jgi:hypothetical protein
MRFREGLNNSLSSELFGRCFSNCGISQEISKNSCPLAAALGLFSPAQGHRPVFGRTHAFAPINLPRTIHKLDSANNVKSWAVFFFNPR